MMHMIQMNNFNNEIWEFILNLLTDFLVTPFTKFVITKS